MSQDEQKLLGTIESSELLITELYIDLRKTINRWAAKTHQTAQARMGYVGQHLVSVVTGYAGGRSGARGKDLILGDGRHAEIKTCYRVDQLGKCKSCGVGTASIEEVCPSCGENDIRRNDDSKWLIGIRHDEEFANILDPVYYYLVLFDFDDIKVRTAVRASIWQVDSNAPGFAYCMIDYYLTIRSQSVSKAPFNLWPFRLKFAAMKPLLIYRSLIKANDTIETQIFPGRNEPQLHSIKPLVEHKRSSTLTLDRAHELAKVLGVDVNKSDTKAQILTKLQDATDEKGIGDEQVADAVARVVYLPRIKQYRDTLPSKIKEKLTLIEPAAAVPADK